jgi:hypothetical protein
LIEGKDKPSSTVAILEGSLAIQENINEIDWKHFSDERHMVSNQQQQQPSQVGHK